MATQQRRVYPVQYTQDEKIDRNLREIKITIDDHVAALYELKDFNDNKLQSYVLARLSLRV